MTTSVLSSSPKDWGPWKPSQVFEVTFNQGAKRGAVYIGVYSSVRSPKPKLSSLNYVSFSPSASTVLTSRYRYRFAPKNYLVVNGVEFKNSSYGSYPFISSSSFYLNADLKWFITLTANEHNVTNKLEAYKDGPIRTIARVLFNYQILKLKFELGMYTEVSFFANSVVLPAIVDNPLDGAKTLNPGSEFYYGLGLASSPTMMNITSNMPAHQNNRVRINSVARRTRGEKYWLSAVSDRAMVYLEFQPSAKMLKAGNVPKYYIDNQPFNSIRGRGKNPKPLGKSPVNFALGMDLRKFPEGTHTINLRLFLDSIRSEKILNEYKMADQWVRRMRRLPM